MKKYKSQIAFITILLVISVLFYFLGQVLLPFAIALLFAYGLNPFIKKIQLFIPNRNLAVSFYLVITLFFAIGTLWVFGSQVAQDFKRLNKAFVTFSTDNSTEIDKTANEVKSYIKKIYPDTELNKELSLESKIDSLNINTETITESLTKITSFIGSQESVEENDKKLNWFLIIISSIGYFIYIIYTYPYFEKKFKKYFSKSHAPANYLDGILNDFNRTFLQYFRQRSKIVLICTAIFTISFLIIGIPGAILFGLIAGVLCYISHFHYLSLIPISLSCWVLSIEQNHSFYLYFGLIILVFILVSVLEEFVFFPKIMKNISSMNPAIMMISLSVWSYIFGTLGLLIALPLTTFLLLYLDRILLFRKNKLEESINES